MMFAFFGCFRGEAFRKTARYYDSRCGNAYKSHRDRAVEIDRCGLCHTFPGDFPTENNRYHRFDI